MRYIFIDGYNIINSWSDLAISKEESLENSRQRLIEILENYVAMREDKLYLVFDAHLSKGSIEKEEKVNNVIEFNDVIGLGRINSNELSLIG